jgi:hypothetical protein
MYPLDKILLCTACEIAVYGWMSASKSRERAVWSTAHWVQHMLDLTQVGIEHRANLLAEAKVQGIDLFDPKYKEEVEKAIEWAKTSSPAMVGIGSTTMVEPTEYQLVIAAIAIAGRVHTAREVATACSILAAYRSTRAHHLPADKSEWVGVPTDPITLKVVVKLISNVSAGPSRWTVVARREPGSMIKGTVVGTTDRVCWFDGQLPTLFLVDETVTIKGTVKRHETFRGIKETRLTKVVRL